MYTPGISIITLTGGRQASFELCQKYVERQVWGGELQWVIVNDFPDVNSEIKISRPGTDVTRIYPTPLWAPGQNTHTRNLLAALKEVAHEKVLFFEDDDHYSRWFCEEYSSMLDASPIVGNPVSRYYHLPTRQFRLMRNHAQASLCQTGIRAEMIPLLESICRQVTAHIDSRLWGAARTPRLLRSTEQNCVGMKGLPGRPGIGVGHSPETCPHEWTWDPRLDVLRSWIGDDVALYERVK